MKNPKGCWRQCAAAALALFCAVGLNVNVFGVYLPYLTKLYGLTHTQTSAFSTLRSLFCCAAILVGRWYYRKLDIRLGFSLAVLVSAVSSLLYAVCGQYWVMCAAACLSGIAFGLGGMYPASILIHRWFLPAMHEGLALGICSAATGVASTVCAPIITAVAEKHSVQTAFMAQMLVMLASAAVCFLLLRNRPEGAVREEKVSAKTAGHAYRIDWMFISVIAIGAFGVLGFQYVSMIYTFEGFSAYQVSLLVSIVGLALTVGKFVAGALFDRLGAVRTNRLIFAEVLVGFLLFCLGKIGGFAVAVAAVLLYGMGNCMGTVGLSVYAADLAAKEDYNPTLQLYQFAYPLGALIFGTTPGLIADATGSYRGFYAMLAALCVFSFAVIQLRYRKKAKTEE